MNCIKDIILQGFLDGELAHEERAGIEDHLKQCASCRQRVKMRQNTLASLNLWMQDIELIPSAPPRRRTWFAFLWRPVQVPLGGLSLLLLILLVSVYVLLRRPPMRTPVESSEGVFFFTVKVDGEETKRWVHPVHLRDYEVITKPKTYIFKEKPHAQTSI